MIVSSIRVFSLLRFTTINSIIYIHHFLRENTINLYHPYSEMSSVTEIHLFVNQNPLNLTDSMRDESHVVFVNIVDEQGMKNSLPFNIIFMSHT